MPFAIALCGSPGGDDSSRGAMIGIIYQTGQGNRHCPFPPVREVLYSRSDCDGTQLCSESYGMAHILEKRYGLTAIELLDAVEKRFRLRAALEGAVAEIQMESKIKELVGTEIERYEAHDLDGKPDFSLWLPGREMPLQAECKNVRESSKPGGEAYRKDGVIIAFKVETQKTRTAMGDPSSRFYDIDQYQILGVCIGKKSGRWPDILFVKTRDLQRHSRYPKKLAVMQRVPLPGATDISPWYLNLSELLKTI